ncbi:putative beta-flanking protein [Erysiphe neolycopersici]|uniref:Putative beta-flanking protein n=1 Tax=Erysiphe neolycopersici TaxID=212602 RepID=A0A420I3J0_9PEZI|nr:putative beta-flanking protein [Erysiphe neolycopersici]
MWLGILVYKSTHDGRHIEDDHDLTSAAVHATKHSGNNEEAVTFTRVVCSLGKIKQSTSKDLDINARGWFFISLCGKLVLTRGTTLEAAELQHIFFPLLPSPSPPRIKATSSEMGIAAAIQALKMITGVQSGENKNTYICLSPITPQGSSNNMNALVGIAMAEASMLFEAQKELDNLARGASKEKAIYEAGEKALQMYLKSNGSSSGGLITLAAKFL